MFQLGKIGQSQNNVTSTGTPQINPQQLAFVKNMLSQKGMSAEAMVRQICGQRGINVDEFMAQFREVNLP